MPVKDQKTTLRTFAVASFLNDLGADAIRPLWPLFITNVLGVPATVLGLLDGIGEAISYGSRMPAGMLSDKFKTRKPIVIFGYLLAGLGRLGYALAPSFGWLFPAKAADRLGKMRDPPRDALLADITKPTERGRAFGVLGAADHLGASIGPLVGLLLLALLGFRGAILISALPSLVGAFLVWRFVKDRKPSRELYRLDHFGRRFWRLTIFSALFGLSWISLSFMVLSAITQQKQSALWSPLLFFVMSLCAVISSIASGTISDRIGRKHVLTISYVSYACVPLGFLITQLWEIRGDVGLMVSMVLFAVYGFHYGSMSSVMPAFISDLIPSSRRASAIGTFQTVFGLCALIASVLAGITWDLLSPAAVFGAAAAISFLACISFAMGVD